MARPPLPYAYDEAKEVLKLNPLPEDWIWDIAGGHARPWPDDNIESCKQWIEWIIKKLENQCRLYKKEPNEAMNIIMRNK